MPTQEWINRLIEIKRELLEAYEEDNDIEVKRLTMHLIGYIDSLEIDNTRGN